MRNIPGYVLLCLAFMLGFGRGAAAWSQVDSYDKALDKYAAICDRCIGLRAKVEAGQSVRMESLKSLLAELSSLRETLSDVSGKMSAAQVGRFEAIKAKYLRGMKSFEASADAESGNVPEMETVRRPFVPLPDVAPLPVTGLAEAPGRLVGMPSRQTRRQPSRTTPFKFAVLADAGMFPVPSCGAMVVATWNGIGAYAGCRSNYRRNEYSYGCTSGGDTEYGRIWATGKSRVSRTMVTAGFAMFPSRRFGFHAGGGMTSCTRCWEDFSGQWARVEDRSFKNPAADAGIFLTFDSLILSLSVTSDFSGHADAQFGLGFRF